jgi:hypothetical protein
MIPSVSDTPNVGEGHASRTKNARRGSSGAGRTSVVWRSRPIERPQPVAPVPVVTTMPDDDWRSEPAGQRIW